VTDTSQLSLWYGTRIVGVVITAQSLPGGADDIGGPGRAPQFRTAGEESIEREACENLGVPTLREYFRKPAGFFADHLKRYSKSRRQAPIYRLRTKPCATLASKKSW